MPIISIEIMKTIDQREMQKTKKHKQRQKGARGTEAITKGWKVSHSIAFLDVFISGINNQISHFKHIANQPIQDFS